MISLVIQILGFVTKTLQSSLFIFCRISRPEYYTFSGIWIYNTLTYGLKLKPLARRTTMRLKQIHRYALMTTTAEQLRISSLIAINISFLNLPICVQNWRWFVLRAKDFLSSILPCYFTTRRAMRWYIDNYFSRMVNYVQHNCVEVDGEGWSTK